MVAAHGVLQHWGILCGPMCQVLQFRAIKACVESTTGQIGKLFILYDSDARTQSACRHGWLIAVKGWCVCVILHQGILQTLHGIDFWQSVIHVFVDQGSRSDVIHRLATSIITTITLAPQLCSPLDAQQQELGSAVSS